MGKRRVAVVYGGKSGEHEISLLSAAAVLKNLDRSLFDVIPVAIDKQGQWLLNTLPDVLPDGEQAARVESSMSQAISIPQSYPVNGSKTQELFDVVFPIMHGPLYEDGCMQGMLQLAELPFVGPSLLGAAIAMDKAIAKQLVQAAGIPVIPWVTVTHGEWKRQTKRCDDIINELGLPLFVKSMSLGSSVGTYRVTTEAELHNAIDEALRYDLKIIIEQAFPVREIELAVLESLEPGAAPLVSVPGEIKVSEKHTFYSYEAKYLDKNGASLLIPAELSSEQQQEAQAIAKKAFIALQGCSMARADLFLHKETNQFYFNELNTIPGFTEISMYPKLWEASGMAYTQLLTHLVELAVARHALETNIDRHYEP